MKIIKWLQKIPKRKRLLFSAIALALIFVVALFGLVSTYKKEPKMTLMYLGGGIDPGSSATLSIKYEPASSYHPPFKVESTNANVASVSDNLVVTGRRAGETTVTITTESGQTSSVDVRVKEPKIKKTIFLTYDDGPGGDVTGDLLKVLKEHKAKATFFVKGEDAELDPEMLAKANREGHTIAVGTYGSEYSMIYKNVDTYLEDFDKVVKIIQDACGTDPIYWRFPGGRSNDFVSDEVEDEILRALHKRGYSEMDWNCSVNDGVGIDYSAEEMTEYAISSIETAIGAKTVPIVHLHDSAKSESAAAITEGIIEEFGKRGYKFKGLNDYYGPEVSFGNR